ncbi:MAG TPA: TonB-dependent receptor, partial [Pyrinomonadaceae bacterium]|nr:TonB-dependent receptor [Pyrinomonadaceae bacterium]
LTGGLPGLGFVTLLTYQVRGGKVTDALQRHINIVDNFSIITGTHSLKFGVDFRRLSPVFGTLDAQGVEFFFEESIRSGKVDLLTITTNQPAEPQFNNYSVYAQDTWKVSKRLTLDLGLRWELNPAPTEKEGRMPPLVVGVEGRNVSGVTLAPEGTEFYKMHWTAFAPRLGAAYQLRTKPGSETVLRGGFGVYYDLGSGTASAGWPLRATISQDSPTEQCPMIFPLADACLIRPGIVPVTPANTRLFNVAAPNPNLKLPYSLHWNFAVEQSLGKDQTVSVSYVASASRQLLVTLLLNQQPRSPITGALLPRPNPNFRDIRFSFNGPTSDYHSMQAQYRTRLKEGLQALVNYTWAHAIDEVSTDNGRGILERGNANFDVRHNFSAALNYDLPNLNSVPFLRHLTRGWSASAIIHAKTGRPINVSMASTNALVGFVDLEGISLTLRPDLVQGVPLYVDDPSIAGGRRFNPAAFADPTVCLPSGAPNCVRRVVRQGTLGRNVLRELPLIQVDFALARTFKLGERVVLQLKGEAFNLFNRPMFGDYQTVFGQANTVFGAPRNTLNQALGGLDRLYQLGGPRSVQLAARLSF